MKQKLLKYSLLAVAAIAAAACEKTPSGYDRDGEMLVYTTKGENADFSGYATYNIGDKVLVVSGRESEYSDSPNATALLNEVKEQMTALGYVYEPDIEKADVGLQVTYMEKTETYVSYMSDPYWWLDYPGYWGAGYWGSWGGWYHPYPVTYSASTTSLMLDMADLTAEEGEDKKLPVIWSAFAGGATGYSMRNDMKRLEMAIGQAFSQSSYLKK